MIPDSSGLESRLRAPKSRREGGVPPGEAEVAMLTMGIPVVGVGDAAEALLSGRIPDLEGRWEQRGQPRPTAAWAEGPA